MALIDTLILTDPAPGGAATPPTFTVNTAVTEVVATFVAAPLTYYGIFTNAAGLSEFIPNDNLEVLSMTLVLPYCFGISTAPAEFSMVWRDTAGGSYAVEEWGTVGFQYFHGTNVEIEMNEYLPWNPLLIAGATNSQLAVSSMVVPISMIGVPAVLDTTVQDIQIVLKVKHNFPLE